MLAKFDGRLCSFHESIEGLGTRYENTYVLPQGVQPAGLLLYQPESAVCTRTRQVRPAAILDDSVGIGAEVPTTMNLSLLASMFEHVAIRQRLFMHYR